ncbi:DUF2183 domain-containing protein [bacterium]|nr:DUF2183 domain-containing protein [bacterium]
MHMIAPLFVLSVFGLFGSALASDGEQVTFYTTYGYREGDAWVVPMRVWVHERRNILEKVITEIAASMGSHEPREIDNFRSRIQDFVADSESREAVAFRFDNDPETLDYHVQDSRGDIPQTDQNGLVEGMIRIPAAKADELQSLQGSRDGWLTIRAVSRGHSGTGQVRLVPPSGLSVISDIDDTIKITEIRAGTRVVVRNTFFRDFSSPPGMAKLYQGWKGASFHYISGAPWQLFRPLSDYLFNGKTGFPEGTFHMKNARKNLFSASTWEDLIELVTNENLTFQQKGAQIKTIMERFPERKFILVGDSGEKDPEVYDEIRKRYPGQVREIVIRDVVNDREKNPARLEGMTVIDAGTSP